MQLGLFKIKNTVLLFVLALISCGNFSTSKSDNNDSDLASSPDIYNHNSRNENYIIVGANRTELYLPLLKGKRIGIAANPTSVIFKKNGYTPFAPGDTLEIYFQKSNCA